MSSNPPAEVVIDSVVLHYFLLVDRYDLLAALLRGPMMVPRIVYDPDEPGGTPPASMCEMNRAIDFQRRRAAADRSRQLTSRSDFDQHATRLSEIVSLIQDGHLEIVDMSEDELRLFGALTNPERASEFGLTFPLDAGEASCVAIAKERGWTIATDDSDGLKALNAISPRHSYERIRKLLMRAVNEGLLSRSEANRIHDEMTTLGFWDRQRPFPNER